MVLEVLMCGLATTLLTGMDNTRMKRKQSAKDKIYHSVNSHQNPLKNVRLEGCVLRWDEKAKEYRFVKIK